MKELFLGNISHTILQFSEKNPLRKLTSGMTVFMLNPPSNILVIRLVNVVVVLTQSLHELFPRGKHSENCYLFSPTVQSKQNLEGMSSTCVRKVLLYGSETGPVVTEDVQRLVTADSGMIRWICGVSLKGRIPTTYLLLHLGLNSISDMLRWKQLRFHGHLIPWNDDAWPKKATMHYVDGRQPRGRPCKRFCDVVCADMKSLNLSNEDANNRAVWRRAIKQKKSIQYAGILPAHVDSGR